MKIYRTKKSEQAILSTYDKLLDAWDVPVEK